MHSKRHHDETGGSEVSLTHAAGDSRQLWHRALSLLGGPALRLHHYRGVRTRLLHDALEVRENRQAGKRLRAQRGDMCKSASGSVGA